MKQIILLVGIILFGINAKASHLMGGMVGVFQTSQDSTTVGMWLISDGQSPIPMPSTIYIEKWEMNSVGWYVKNGTISLTLATSNTFQGNLITNYTSGYMDLDSNKYRFIYKNCCWGIINNSTNSMTSKFVISADYWHIPYNSTPYARVPFIINQQVGARNTMKPIWGWNTFLENPDGFLDQVSISQTDIYSEYDNGVFTPQIHTWINAHVDNDSISWVPQSVGKYSTGFEITDTRPGFGIIGVQRIQWTYNVVSSTLDIVENDIPIVYDVYDWLGNHIYHGENIPYYTMNGLYILKFNNTFEKIFVN